MKIASNALAMLLAVTGFVFGETVYPFGGTVAQLADGGGIQTAITLVNLEDVPASYTLRFRSNSGSALSLVTDAGTGSAFSGTLPSRGSRTISTAGFSVSQAVGWAQVDTTSAIGGSALYRVSVAPWIGAEATLPIDTGIGNHYLLAFDQTTGASNGIALVNPSSFAATTIFVTVKDESGLQFVLDSFTMAPLSHRSFVMASQYPATNGRRGIVEISGTGAELSVLALRFSGASIASILPLKLLALVSARMRQTALPY